MSESQPGIRPSGLGRFVKDTLTVLVSILAIYLVVGSIAAILSALIGVQFVIFRLLRVKITKPQPDSEDS